MTVISIINQKGGVGKTTTAEAIAAGLALKGYKVLAIDLDQQCNFTNTFYEEGEDDITSFEILNGEATAKQAIKKTAYCDFIPCSGSMSSIEALLTENGRPMKDSHKRLAKALSAVKNQYDYVVVDTPPALGTVTANALTASDKVVITATADIYSLQGIKRVADTIESAKKFANPSLVVDGILLTKYSPRSTLSKQAAEMFKIYAKDHGTRLYKSTIREAVVVREAQLCQKSLYDYAPKAPVTEDYEAFLNELIGSK